MYKRQELHHAAAECLISFCEEKLHCPVQLADLQSVTLRGQYSPSEHRILLNDRLNDTQLISTLAHEMGHAMLHTLPEARELSAAQREIEADTVSILLAGHLGIDIPVSYTHLDVYKRQGLSPRCARPSVRRSLLQSM